MEIPMLTSSPHVLCTALVAVSVGVAPVALAALDSLPANAFPDLPAIAVDATDRETSDESATRETIGSGIGSGTCPVICGEIIAHKQFKARIADRPLAERRRLHAKMGIAFGDADSESVAVYVRAPLTSAEFDALDAKGLRVNRSLFVPPLPGRHEHGFYLARMNYSSIDRVRGDDRIVRVASTDFLVEPLHDIALDIVNIASVQLDPKFSPALGPYFGGGVTVTVADSGVDLDHPDLPTPIAAFDVTTGDWEPDWSTNVANTVIWHGTHVTGTVVGSGVLSSGAYAGAAPAANLVVHKIGNDTNGSSTYANMIKSVSHAGEIGSAIYTVSYGGSNTYLDGSSAIAQAFDATYEAGTLCFASAGNSGANKRHYSAEVAPGESNEFTLVVNNSEDEAYVWPINLRVIWRDDLIHDDLNVHLECLSLDEEEAFELIFADTSPRNTEAKRYVLWPNIPANSSRTYTLRLSNDATTGGTPLVHVYQISTGAANFPDADPFYTVGSPAVADTVLAVGAWVHRNAWTDSFGNNWGSGQPADTIATFSSRGPRVDGAVKPDIVAPGSMMISLRDGVFANSSWATISNDGVNDGGGPANYYVAQGTSMAAPIAAGGAALVREAAPMLSIDDFRALITSTASHAETPNDLVGHGMIDVGAAIEAHLATSLGDLDGNGVVDGADLGILLGNWGSCPDCPADLNGDGVVDGADLGILLSNWS